MCSRSCLLKPRDIHSGPTSFGGLSEVFMPDAIFCRHCGYKREVCGSWQVNFPTLWGCLSESQWDWWGWSDFYSVFLAIGMLSIAIIEMLVAVLEFFDFLTSPMWRLKCSPCTRWITTPSFQAVAGDLQPTTVHQLTQYDDISVDNCTSILKNCLVPSGRSNFGIQTIFCCHYLNAVFFFVNFCRPCQPKRWCRGS